MREMKLRQHFRKEGDFEKQLYKDRIAHKDNDGIGPQGCLLGELNKTILKVSKRRSAEASGPGLRCAEL